MPATATKTSLAWPGKETVANVWLKTGEALTALEDANIAYRRLLDVGLAPSLKEGAPVPTAADVGILAANVSHARLIISHINSEFQALEELLDTAGLEWPIDREEA